MKKKLLLNTILSLALQVITVLCGFILPRIVLEYYGSEINGLVQSITQFLGLISFMELGVGAVIQSALYKPLAENDTAKIDQVVSSGNRFFQRLALVLVGYVAVLIVSYPFFSGQTFSWLFTATLIGAMSVSFFAQYFFGMTDGLLLSASQRGYVKYSLQILTILANTIVCFFLIRNGLPIQFVKLITSLIYLARPFLMRIYVNRHYHVNRRAKVQGEPIKQKWNGVSQHVATVVIEGTDNVVLTTCSTLTNVSIYSVYHGIVYGIKNLFIASTNGFQSVLGDYYAKQDDEKLTKSFGLMELLVHTLTMCLFTCTGVLILPFVEVYTRGIADANQYIQPLFAILIVVAHGAHCLRLPYHILIKASGHYKQTQMCYLFGALINVIVSIACVFALGLVGVAIGTLTAMLFQTVWMIVYDSRNLIKFDWLRFSKLLFADVLIVATTIVSTIWLKMSSVTYLAWLVLAFEVFGCSLLSSFLVTLVLFRKQVFELWSFLFGKFRKRRDV